MSPANVNVDFKISPLFDCVTGADFAGFLLGSRVIFLTILLIEGLYPIKQSALLILKKASKTTATPANLKKDFANEPLTTDVKPPIPSSPGAVPIANSPITKEPVTKLPLLIATSCIAWVNPQGRKKDKPPSTMA